MSSEVNQEPERGLDYTVWNFSHAYRHNVQFSSGFSAPTHQWRILVNHGIIG